ncbi:hypothetical protein ACQV2S_01170 [Facklamia sp. P13064]|uniref:hypothetical protein n=1 Tax=Facklamia sp. P13064 TaxID=3421953 RepID=UPI003D171E30
MAKYKVLKPIKDLETNKRLEVGEEVELTVKRVEESEKKYGKGYLERIEDKGPSKGGE